MARNKVRGGYQPLDLAELCTPLHWDEIAPAALTGTALPLSSRIKRKQLPYYHAIAVVRPLTPALAALVLVDAVARGYQEAGLLAIQTTMKRVGADTVLPARKLVPIKRRKPKPTKHCILEYDIAELAQLCMTAARRLAQQQEDVGADEPAQFRFLLPEPLNPYPGYSPLSLGAEDRITLVIFRPALSPGIQLRRRLSRFRLQLPEPLTRRQMLILLSLNDWLEHLHYLQRQLTALALTGTNVKTRRSEYSGLIPLAFKLWQADPMMSSGELYDRLPQEDENLLPSPEAVAKWLHRFHLGWIPDPEPVSEGTSAAVSGDAEVRSEHGS